MNNSLVKSCLGIDLHIVFLTNSVDEEMKLM